MKAIQLNSVGGVENLEYVEIPNPIINENEVLISVSAISINPVDFKTRQSEAMVKMFFQQDSPVILGWDVSGVVVESRSSKFNIGDEVFGMVNFPGKGNAYADLVAAPAEHIALKPANVSHEEAAAATLAALTALQALKDHGKLTATHKVLINGASGGVGHYATQIARHTGAYVIGTSSAKNKSFVLDNGADLHIDYTSQRIEDEIADVDLVLDTIGHESIITAIDVTKAGGTVISIVSGAIPQEYLDYAKSKNVNLYFILVKSSASDMETIAQMLTECALKSHVSVTFPFSEMRAAHLQLEKGRTIGKMVITL